ncbi:MAG TPA: hypothetical protein VFF68_00920, partial [Anaerolineaceae bacterium]|nr:hypothetical protein [Anaerolineaceae bacterium]
YYEAGMDLGLSDNKVTSFRLFQQRIINEYDKMVDEFKFTVVDGTLPVQEQQQEVRQIVKKALRGWKGLPTPEQSVRRPNNRGKTSELHPSQQAHAHEEDLAMAAEGVDDDE